MLRSRFKIGEPGASAPGGPPEANASGSPDGALKPFLSRLCPQALGTRRGAAAVEMAIVLPLLVLIIVIAVDFCRLFYYDVTLYNCARNGAIYLSDPVTIPQSSYNSVDEATLADWPASITPQPTVAAVAGTAGGANARVTVTWQFQSVTSYLGSFGNVTLSRTVEMRVAPAVPN